MGIGPLATGFWGSGADTGDCGGQGDREYNRHPKRVTNKESCDKNYHINKI